MFVIAGATGNTGSLITDILLAKGKNVRALVRDEKSRAALEKKGAEVAVVDLENEKALTAALAGAEAAYFLSPPDLGAADFLADRKRTFDTIGRAIDAAKLPHVVFLSSVGAQHEKGTGIIASLGNAERRLAQTTAKTTFVRAAYFLENWAAVVPAAKAGVLPTFLRADHTIPMVAAKDIATTVANELLERVPGIVELSGPRDYSSNDIAAVFAKLLGKPVAVQAAPLDAVVPTYTGFGMSPGVAELFRGMYEGIGDGTVDLERGPGTRQVRGTVTAEQAFGHLLG